MCRLVVNRIVYTNKIPKQTIPLSIYILWANVIDTEYEKSKYVS
jgi:hypothetical protein